LSAVLIAGVLPPAAPAQAAAPSEKPLAFEVVSIRPDASSSLGHGQMAVTPDGWHMAHNTLMAALLTAYIPPRPATP
jgi:hypothetical protein